MKFIEKHFEQFHMTEHVSFMINCVHLNIILGSSINWILLTSVFLVWITILININSQYAKLHITIIQGYGLTEMCPVCTLCPKIMENEKVYRGSVGRPIPNTQVKIVNPKDAENTALGPNIRGELLVKGPQLMKGYRNLPEETKKTITDDGWLRTGDTSYYNEQGFLFIVDRFKDLIKVRGNQVAPAEMEGIIRTFPGVADAAVIGIPDKYSGELPRAYIVPKDGTEVDIKLLDQFVTEKVAKYKQLKGGIVVVKEIPKNPSGKILRKNIRDTYLEKGI